MSTRFGEPLLLALTAIVVLAGATWALVADPLQQLRPAATGSSEPVQAREYILQRPLDAAGWLGWLATHPLVQPTPDGKSSAIVAVVSTLAPMDPQVLRTRANLMLGAGHIDDALDLLEKVALVFPDERGNAFDVMAAAAASAAFPRYIERALQHKSPVVDEFLQHACQNARPLPLLASVATAVVKVRPLPNKILDCVCDRAISANAVPFARWLWLNGHAKLPKAIGFVQNGGFDEIIGQGAFDWRISPGGQFREGFTARVQYGDGDQTNRNHVLAVSFNGRPVRVRIARQTLALPPGGYELRYQYHAGGLKAPLQYAWQIRCLNDDLRLLSTAAPPLDQNAGRWQTQRADFLVPTACTGQELSLELPGKLQQETGGRGTLLFDDVVIGQR